LEIQSKSIEQTTENTGEASEINCNNHNNIHNDHNSINTQNNADVINQQNAETINNINNNIYINNYGSERLDYITSKEILEIIQYCDNNILPKYIVLKHFNPDFPENKNIKCKDNLYLIKTKDKWNIISSDILANQLYSDNSSEIGRFVRENDKMVDEFIQNEEFTELCKAKTDFIQLSVNGTDKDIKKRIKDVIKTHNNETDSVVEKTITCAI